MKKRELVDEVLAIHRIQDAAAEYNERAESKRRHLQRDLCVALRTAYEDQKDAIADGSLYRLYPECFVRYTYIYLLVLLLMVLIKFRIGVGLQDTITIDVMRYTNQLPKWI